ncbi:MAG: hypothetical protein ABI413_04705 [Ktedonobacteraceae bacterium]
MEISNESQAEKHRLQALVKLVEDLGRPTSKDLFDLLQPRDLVGQNDSQDPQLSAKTTLRVAKEFKLVGEGEDHILERLIPREQIERMSAFQHHLGNVVLGVTEAEASNYLFNLFSAWYAVQDERVLFELPELGYDGPFNEQVFPDAPTRSFNSTKLPAWRKWALFLGLGWLMRLGAREILVPDATKRLQPLLLEIFEEQNSLTFTQFMERLARRCPELDGGSLFEYCWQASRGGEERGNRMSLMLSNALRTLDGLGQVRLVYQADALTNWQLYSAQGNKHQRVTHIEYSGK